jgi:hypothetical protein
MGRRGAPGRESIGSGGRRTLSISPAEKEERKLDRRLLDMSRRRFYYGAAAASGALVALAGTASVAFAMPAAAPGCVKSEALKGVFPKASAIAFTGSAGLARFGQGTGLAGHVR